MVVQKIYLCEYLFLAESNTQKIALVCLVRTSLSLIAVCEDGLVKRSCWDQKTCIYAEGLDHGRSMWSNGQLPRVLFSCESNYKDQCLFFHSDIHTDNSVHLEPILLTTIASAKVMNFWNSHSWGRASKQVLLRIVWTWAFLFGMEVWIVAEMGAIQRVMFARTASL